MIYAVGVQVRGNAIEGGRESKFAVTSSKGEREYKFAVTSSKGEREYKFAVTSSNEFDGSVGENPINRVRRGEKEVTANLRESTRMG